MSDLREKIARIAYEVEVKQFGGFDWNVAKEGMGNRPDSDVLVLLGELDGAYETADTTIAAFTEALLQPEVVEAAAEAEHKRMWQGAYSPFTWAEEDTGIKDGIRDSTRETLKAALAAITAPAGDGIG